MWTDPVWFIHVLEVVFDLRLHDLQHVLELSTFRSSSLWRIIDTIFWLFGKAV